MKFSIIVFPGSNCDADCYYVVKNILGQSAEYVWHQETSLKNCDVVILPGGFSYGDYLRCGAIAKFSPIMNEIRKFAERGGLVIGICNGFQILIETGLLPGALMRNYGLKFICDFTPLKLINRETPFTQKGSLEKTYLMPIAHMEGNFFIDPEGLKQLQDNNQIIFEYQTNPNGSVQNIAGICNRQKNVLGMMPHPERVSEKLLGGEDGRFVFESLIS